MFGLSTVTTYGIIAIVAVAMFSGYTYYIYDKGGDSREASINAELAKKLAVAEADAKKQRASDQARNEQLASENETIRTDFAEFKANLPKPETLIKYREVKVSEQVSCPVASLGSEFVVHYNAAASL